MSILHLLSKALASANAPDAATARFRAGGKALLGEPFPPAPAAALSAKPRDGFGQAGTKNGTPTTAYRKGAVSKDRAQPDKIQPGSAHIHP